MDLRQSHLWFLLTGLLASSAQAGPPVQDLGKVTFLAFGEFYNVGSHNRAAVDGKSGLQFRRVYLTYDATVDPNFSFRFRLEGNSPSDFGGGSSLDPFIKDLYVQYKGRRNTRLQFGLQPTPAFSLVEELLGTRQIEKTPLDLYRFADSRDQGVSLKTDLIPGRLAFSGMAGFASGAKGPILQDQYYGGALILQASSNLSIQIYADSINRTSAVRWRTMSTDWIYKGGAWTASLLLARQTRVPSGGGASTHLNLTSATVNYEVDKKLSLYARVDRLNSPLPGAEKIGYISFAKDGKPSLVIVGLRYRVSDDLEIIPNIEQVSYQRSGTSPKPGGDRFLRLTFFYRV